MNDVDLALDQISDIRARLAASTRFLGLSPEFNLLLGGLAFVIALAQVLFSLALDSAGFVIVWSVFLITSSGMATLEAITRARREHGRMANTILVGLLQKVMPFVLATVVLTWVIYHYSLHVAWLLPGLWQLLLGLLGFAALASLPRAIVWVACWYFCCGIVVLGVSAQAQLLSPWMMGLPFGIGQLLVGAVLLRAKGADSV